MRFAILSADYPAFLRKLYSENPDLFRSSYADQMAARNDSLFGVADFYSRNFIAHGHEAIEIHINNAPMQYAWCLENGVAIEAPASSPGASSAAPLPTSPPPFAARETVLKGAKKLLRPFKPVLAPLLRPLLRRSPALHHGISDWELQILKARFAVFKPDVILNQELAYLPSRELASVTLSGTTLMGQIASSLPEHDRFGVYNTVISSLPNQVEWFRKRGVKSELNRLAFEPSILDRLGPAPARDVDVSFVGSLSPDHVSRIAFLEYVATRTPLKVWGNGIERLPQSSPLHGVYQGEAWGRDMYEVIRRSKITLNFHIDLAEDWANNMRLYEATGMGALLLTDWKKNLHEMFVPGEHVAAYADAQDCVHQIKALLTDDATRKRIAAAGQQRAIMTQNYHRRVGEIVAMAEKLRSGA